MAVKDKEVGTKEEAKKEYKVVGSSPIRHDATDKITGRALYGGDFRAAGLLHGKVLRSPHAHARIRSIDVSRALAHPGVKAVATSEDLPNPEDKMAELGEGSGNIKYLSRNSLAKDKVLYEGHAVVGVAAVNPHVAEEALALIDVDYEVLAPVMDVLAAMKDDAPILLDDLRTDSEGEKSEEASNVASHIQYIRGDIEKGFAEADAIAEGEFRTATVHQGYIEPQNASAHWTPDGRLTIWTSTQGAFMVRDQISDIMHLPAAKIKVVPMELGGGFGGKVPTYLDPVAAILSRKSGRPVKMIMTREEVLKATGPTPGSYIRAKIGAKKDGTITAAEAWLAYEAGAYPGSPIGAGAQCMFAPYNIPNAKVDGFDVVVNKPKTQAYRAPGATNASFAAETLIDELCEKLSIDPLMLREKSGAKEGTRRVDGPMFPRIGHLETVEAAKNHDHYNASLKGPNRGRGVASGFWFNGGGKSVCSLAVNADGSVSMVSGSSDLAGTRTALSMQAAEVLGIPVEDFIPSVGDTDSIGYTGVSGGSRVTFATGWAAIEAAKDIKGQMMERAALIWDVPVDQVTHSDGVFQAVSDPSLKFTFKELAGKLDETGVTVVGRGSVDGKVPGPAFTTHIVDVEVDPETGKVDILRYTAVQDVGKAVHPDYTEGQIQGGVVQGIGWGLNEEYFYNEEGKLTNSSLLDYRMPTALDLPMIDTVMVEVANPGHPFGVRGVGEVPIIPPPAAIANAIYHAIGVRMNILPMSPRHVLEALWKNGK